MSLWPSALTIGGTTIDLADVLADVSVRHGREDVYSDPTPSTCQIVILGATHAQVKAFQVGAPLVLTVSGGPPPNLAPNGDFETDVVGWTASVCTVARSTAAAKTGLASALITANSGSVATLSSAQTIPVVGSKQYTFSFWVRRQAGARQIKAQANWINASGGTISASIGTGLLASDSGFELLTARMAAPAAAVKVGIYVRLEGGVAAAGDAFYVDNVQFSQDGTTSIIPRFTGTVTDGGLDVDNLTVIAVGKLATLGEYKIGTSGVWPVETWSARVSRCFAEAGLSSLLELQPHPGFDPQLAARDSATAGPTTLRDYLGFLAPMVGAAIADRPDGKILVQAMGARTIAAAYALAPADVAYAPAWEIVLPAGNIITVRYTGDQSQSVTVTDAASVGIYGPRPATIDTSFVNAADATARANLRLARSAYAHWNMGAAPVLRGLTLPIGTPVELHTMPAASPYDPWTPILEGWTDTISGGDPDGPGTWTMELGLSDPLASGLVLPWNAVPPTPVYQWNTINPTTAWRDALTLDSLTA